MSVWREEDHPRGEDGRFVEKQEHNTGLTDITFPYESCAHYKEHHKTYGIEDVARIVEESPNPDNAFRELISQGKVNLRVSEQKQRAHIPLTIEYERRISKGDDPSILTADAEELVRMYAGKGELVMFNSCRTSY